MLNKLKNNAENVKKITVTFVDQSVLSATSFIINAFLATYLLKENYALYVIALSINDLILSVQNALVTTQLTIQAPAARSIKIKQFLSCGLLSYQFVLVLIFVLLSIVVKDICEKISFSKQYIDILPIIAISSLGILFREYLRNYYFVDIKPKMVLLMDLSYILLILIIVLYFKPQVLYILVLMGVISGCVSLMITLKYDKHLLLFSYKKIQYAIKKSWKYSKWSLLGVIIVWIQSNAYIYIIDTMYSASKVADVSFSRLLLMPTALFVASWGRFYKPKCVYVLKRENNPKKLFNINIITSNLLFVGVVLYSILLYFLAPFLNKYWLHDKFLSLDKYIIFWACVFGIRAVRLNYSILLQVFYKFKNLTYLLLLSSIISVQACYWGVKYYGTFGGIFSLIIGEMVLVCGMLLLLRKTVKNMELTNAKPSYSYSTD